MKVQSLKLNCFKKFKNFSLDFTNPETGLAKDLILLVGVNGTGKSTILQAIAATVGTACGRLQNANQLNWPGFNWEISGNNWSELNLQIEMSIQFAPHEIEATRQFSELVGSDREGWSLPSEERIVQLTLHQSNHKALAPSGKEALFQFKGRDYAKQLYKREGFQVFEKVGTVFWYTEQRNSTSLTPEDAENEVIFTEDLLRDRLAKYKQFHDRVESGQFKLRPGQKDLYAEIESAYHKVFPNRKFQGIELQEDMDYIFKEPWFYLFDGKNKYELSEMSGGERAIFPILFDFVRLNIHHSIILIDELELHLHPPMQQALLRALPKLGKNNQFIITTHSDYIEELVPDDCIVRMDG